MFLFEKRAPLHGAKVKSQGKVKNNSKFKGSIQGMASYHCSVKVGGKGKAAAHAAYISREGKYSDSPRYEDLECTSYGNLPKWAEQNPVKFWQAADEYERANGATYREIEVALPRELSPEQRRELVEDFVLRELGERHAYQWAIHTPKAALEGGEQPHAHIMYSERTNDGIERNSVQYFKRYNAKQPERGGCKKDSAGTEERLLATRQSWAEIQNQHLARHGHAARVDHRSLKEQGIDREPEFHLGGIGVRKLAATDISALLEYRAAEGERERAQRELLSIIDLSTDLAAAQKDSEVKPPEKVGLIAKVKAIFTLKTKIEPVKVEPVKTPELDLKPSREEKITHVVTQAAPVELTKPEPQKITPEQQKKQYEDMPIREVFESYNRLNREGIPRDKMHPTLVRRVDEWEKRQAAAAPKEAPKEVPKEVPKPIPKKAEPTEMQHEFITPEKLTKQYEKMPIEQILVVYRDYAKVVSREEIHPTLVRRVDEWGKQQAAVRAAEIVISDLYGGEVSYEKAAKSLREAGADVLAAFENEGGFETYPAVLEFLKQKEAKERVKEVKVVKPKKSAEKDQELDL